MPAKDNGRARRLLFDGGTQEIGWLPLIGITSSNRRLILPFTEFEAPSGFPIFQEATNSAVNIAATSHNFAYPTTVLVGDLLIAIIELCDGTSNVMTVTDPSGGWQRLHYSQYNQANLYVIVKDAIGDEDSGTFNVITDLTTRGICQILRYANWADSGNILNDIEIAVSNGFTGISPNYNYDPPSLNPTNWDLENTKWVAGTVHVFNGLTSRTGSPTNYTDLNSSFSEDTSPRMQIHTMQRNLQTASEDPGAYIFSNNNPGINFTIAIRPTVAGAPPLPRMGEVSWAEMETSAAPNRQVRVPWAEAQFNDFAKWLQCSHAYLEVPSNDRHSQVGFGEVQFSDFFKSAQIGQAEFETPSTVIPPSEISVFTLLVELEVAMEVSVVNQGSTPWLSSGASTWFYNLGTRNTIDGIRREVVGVSVSGGKELIQANSVFHCQNTDGTWFYLTGQNEVFVNPWGSTTDPNDVISLVKMKLCFSNYAVSYGGNFYEPRLLLSPTDLNKRLITNEVMEGGTIIEGQIRLANGDGFIDSLLKDYIVIGQKITLKVLEGEVAYNLGTNIIGEIVRTDSTVTGKLWS